MADAAELGDPARAVDAVAGGAGEVLAVDRQHRELGGGPPEERVVVPLDGRARPALADLRLLQPRRVREVGDVEQRQLQALHAAVARRLLADAEQQLLAHRVQVGGVAGDLQLAHDARVVRVGEVERVERVRLAERDDVADVADEADRVDPLAEAEAADLAALEQVPVAPVERRDLALGLRAEAERRRGAQHALVLGQRELVEQRARHRAAGRVPGAIRVRCVEAVDRGVGAGERAVIPALGRDVQGRRRGVDGVGAREDRVGVHGRQALPEIDGVDGQHAGAAEDRRAPDRAAADRARRDRHAGARDRELRRRQPAGRPRAQLGRPVDRLGVGGDDHPRGAAGQARVDDVAVDVLGAQHLHLRGIRDVDLGHARAERAAAEHEHAVLAQQHRRAPALVELERPEQLRRVRARVDRVERPVREREDRLPVGLDGVGLVDAGLLDVGLRRVLAGARVALGRDGHRHRRRRASGENGGRSRRTGAGGTWRAA